MRRRKLRETSFGKLSIAAGAALVPMTARGQLFVANADVPSTLNESSVGEYSTSGTAINTSLITGLANYSPQAIAISGSALYVANGTTVEEYTTSGAVVHASLNTGFNSPIGLAVSGSELYVSNDQNDTIVVTSSTTVNAAKTTLITGLSFPEGIAISGSELFVANSGNNTIGEYTLSASGTSVISSTPALISTGLSGPQSIAISGQDLFVTNFNNGTVYEYTTSGAMVGTTALISGLGNSDGNADGIAVYGSDLFVTTVRAGMTGQGNAIGEYDATSGDAVNSFTAPGGLSDPDAIVVADAQTMIWNGGNSAQIATFGGNGTWDLNNTPNWYDGLVSSQPASQWMDSTSTGRDTAVFEGTAGNVTLNTSVSAAELQFTTTGYNISGTGNITLGSGGIDASTLTSGNTTLGVAIALASAQSWNVGTGATLSATGNISGPFALTKLGSGTLTLTGSNTYSNGTTISAGIVLANSADTVNGSAGSGLVTVASGAALGGVGQIRGSVTVSGTITAGNATTSGAPGTLTINNSTATTTLAGNGTYDVKIDNATGTAGTNWDELVLSGLSITSSSNSPFTIAFYGLTAANSAGAVPNFNKNSGGNWTVASISGISAATLNTDIAAGDFALNTANFTNNNSLTTSGHFLLDAITAGSDADLQIEYVPTPEPDVCLLFISAAGPMLLVRRRRLHRSLRGVIK